MLNNVTHHSTVEDHPFLPHIPAGARSLMLGTFPPVIKRKFEFFYPNRRNSFWAVVSSIAGASLNSYEGDKAVEERKRILDHLGLAIADMGGQVLRIYPGSADTSIAPVTYTNIPGAVGADAYHYQCYLRVQ
ncbi:hypothetical protein MKQ70_32300 [Chitinophaga sedimenti]|uniref:hypothetical protein n=1 Tax=Chitinophaga sedimenti TaxID=2033606 RepID=UPI002004F8CD|nr:hypothetical protein [Chitinophaga sedimenti]MCK7559399.1 hypothetical protein [Chitinophaga sedimenti]